MLDRGSLRGTWVTVLLPIEADDGITWTKLRGEAEGLAKSGGEGICTNGSAGKFFSQTNAEYRQIDRLVAEICHEADLPFQIGACDYVAA